MNQYHLNDYLLPSPLLRIHKMLHIVDVAVVYSSTDIEDNDSTNLKTYPIVPFIAVACKMLLTRSTHLPHFAITYFSISTEGQM